MRRQNPQYDIITPDTIRDMKACDRTIEVKISHWTDHFIQCISRENKINRNLATKALLEHCQFLYERDTLKVEFTDNTIFKDYKKLQAKLKRIEENRDKIRKELNKLKTKYN